MYVKSSFRTALRIGVPLVITLPTVATAQSTVSLVGIYGLGEHVSVIIAGAVGDSNEIALIEPTLPAIRTYSLNGAFGRSIGRRGQGPGEFTQPQILGRSDGVWWLLEPNRLLEFDQSWKPLRTSSTVDATTLASRAVRETNAAVIGRLPGGELLVQPMAGFDRPEGWKLPLLAFTSSDATIDTVDWYQTYETELRIQSPFGMIVGSQPFGPSDIVSSSQDGRFLAVAEMDFRRRVVELRITDVVTRKRTTQIVPQIDHVLTDHDFNAVLDRLTLSYGSRMPGSGSGFRANLAKVVYRPPLFPYVAGMLVEESGTVWLKSGWVVNDSTEWRRISPDGQSNSTLRLPRSARVLAGRSGRLWVVVLNADNLPFLAIYEAP